MAVHTIMLPDRLYGDEPRSVIRDDVAGTVEGTYSDVPVMRKTLARPTHARELLLRRARALSPQPRA